MVDMSPDIEMEKEASWPIA